MVTCEVSGRGTFAVNWAKGSVESDSEMVIPGALPAVTTLRR